MVKINTEVSYDTEYNQYFQSSDYQHSRPPKPKFPWFRIIIIALIAGIIEH